MTTRLRRFIIALVVLGACALSIAQTQIIHASGLEADSLDPNNYQSGGSTMTVFHVFDRLVDMEFEPEVRIVPGLATAWEASDDGLVWTFQLRDDVVFHDGTPLDAEAVAYTFGRILDEELGLRSFGTFSTAIGSVEAVGEHEVRFTLNQRYAPFLNLISLPEAGIVSPTAVETFGEEFGFNPVGSGPFRFVSWVRDDRVVLEKNPDYWGPEPRIDRLIIQPVLEPATRVIMLQRGEVDSIAGIPLELLDQLRNTEGIRVLEVPTFRLRLIGINTLVPPLDDRRVRQALNYAVDMEEINEQLMLGTKVLADSPLPPTDFGYSPTFRYPYDPDRARELLAEAGYPDGFTINFLILQQTRDPGLQDALQVMRDYWSDVGIETTTTTVEIAAYVDLLDQPPATPEEMAEKALYAQGFNASIMDADYTLRRSFHCDSWAPTGLNRGFYCNPEVDALIDAAGVSTDAAERLRLYAEAQELLMEDAPWVFKYTEALFFAVRDDVQNIGYYPQDLLFFYEAYRGAE